MGAPLQHVWMYVTHIARGTPASRMDQPVKVANPARGQLKGEDIFLPVPDRAFEFGRARRASAIPFCVSLLISTLYWYVDVCTAEILHSKTFFFVPRRKAGQQLGIKVLFGLQDTRLVCLKKNHNAPRPSEHLPVMGERMSKRLGGIKGTTRSRSSRLYQANPTLYSLLVDTP